MKKLILAACAVLALSTSSYAATIAQGQTQHAADKAAGYTFVNPSLNVSIGTLQTKGTITTGSPPEQVQGTPTPDHDGQRCWNGHYTEISAMGFYYSPIKNTCNARAVTYDDFRGRGGYTTSPTCDVSTHTYTFNPGANARDQAVTITQAAGKC